MKTSLRFPALPLDSLHRLSALMKERSDLTVPPSGESWELLARSYVRNLTTTWVRHRIAILTWGVGIPLAIAAAWFVSRI